jgi:F0F1-type ATP synthase assembly protein I
MPDERDSSEKKKFAVQIARYSAIGMMLPAATFIGWLLGTALDRWLGTSWLYLVGLILGIIAGFIELVRTVSSDNK